jgi:nitrogen regulatory protein PII
MSDDSTSLVDAVKPAVAATTPEETKPPMLKLMCFIIDWHKSKSVSSIFEDENVRFHFIVKGKGTANSEVLDLLGIGSSEKAVVLCLEQDIGVPVLLKEVRKKLGAQAAGAGIAFTVPLSGINQPILKVFKQSITKNEKIAMEKEGPKMSDIKQDLIISVVNQGYSEEFMAIAREAGAGGGTIINARGLAHHGPVKFFGVSIQAEKELILILTHREKKAAIMQAVSQAYGISSKAEGIIFSLPVDQVMSLNQINL